MATQKSKKETKEKLVLDDLAPEMAEIVRGKSGIFYNYRSWKEIAQYIIKSLQNPECYDPETKEFYLGSAKQASGILSQAEALISLTTLIENSYITKDAWIYGRIEDLTAGIIKEVKKEIDGETCYIFNASPFNSDFFNKKYSYIDSITWVISAFLAVFRLGKMGMCNTYEVHKEDIIDIVRFGLGYLDFSFIDGEVDNDMWDSGWNFTGGCDNVRPSLYFTYAVSECYIDICDTFSSYIDYYNLLKRRVVDGLEINRKTLADTYYKFFDYVHENFYELTEEDRRKTKYYTPKDLRYGEYLAAIGKAFYSEKDDDDIATEEDYISYIIDTAEGREKRDEIKILEEFFLAINGTQPPYMYKTMFTEEEWVALGKTKGIESKEKTVYDSFESNCKKVAADVWHNVSNVIDENFLNNDLKTVIDKTAIEKSSYSDALFNTLFAINIVINGGLDEEIDFMITDADLSGDLLAKQENLDKYDEMLQTIKAAFDKLRRFDRDLQKKDKEYIVDQCVLGFGENFSGELKDAARELRKQRILTISLVPLIVKTNNIINEYLIKFPQSDMALFLEMILKNRTYAGKNEDGTIKYNWTWERDEYSITSTYYYIQALEYFYSYYEKYESIFIPVEKNNRGQIRYINDVYYKELSTNVDGDIYKLRKENEKLVHDKEELEDRYDVVARDYEILKENRSPLEGAVSEFVLESLQPILLDMVSQAMGEFLNNLADKHYKESALDKNEKQILSSLKGLLKMFIGGYICDTVNSDTHVNASEREAGYARLEKDVLRDFRNVLRIYISQINNSEDRKSDFVKTNGYREDKI